MAHKYNEGQWYMWDGKGKCPLHPKDEYQFISLDGSRDGFHDMNPTGAIEYNCGYHVWDWSKAGSKAVFGGFALIAFYITKKYKEPEAVEMTVEEICKALGKDVKVVK